MYDFLFFPRFLLIFAACLLSLLGKGLALASPFASYEGEQLEHEIQASKYRVATTLSTMFLPGFLLGLASCWHLGILKTFLAHPSILLLPAFTHFTFTSSTKWRKGRKVAHFPPPLKEEGEEEGEGDKTGGEEPFIIFSPKFTLLNLLISVLGSVAYVLIMRDIARWDKIWRRIAWIPANLEHYLYDPLYHIPFILAPILGLLLTLLSLALTSTGQTWCSQPHRIDCCCICFTLPRVEYGILLPSKPHAHYVLGANGKPNCIPEEEEVKRKETDMDNNGEATKIENQDDITHL